ncbi:MULTISPECIES: cache domain-containing protein [unclassified Lebetimonas]|uniref:cache domain-containing protein n=1 Tax=unclassified Lebetimonas TaxID=2648158 RepID=UPI0004B1E1BE|nr:MULTISPECIES: cache domain-containing protein [unclassified Lebetimonas]
MNLKDVDGKYFIKEIIKRALSSKNGAFVIYKWLNPNDNKIEKKTHICNIQ